MYFRIWPPRSTHPPGPMATWRMVPWIVVVTYRQGKHGRRFFDPIRFRREGKGEMNAQASRGEDEGEREKGRIDTISEWLERDEELTFLTLSSFCTVFMMIIVSISTILPRPPHRKHYYYAIYIITDIHLESLSIIARKEGKGNSVLSLWYTLNSVYMHLSIRIYIYRVCVHAYPRVCIRMCVVCVCLLFTFNNYEPCARGTGTSNGGGGGIRDSSVDG